MISGKLARRRKRPAAPSTQHRSGRRTGYTSSLGQRHRIFPSVALCHRFQDLAGVLAGPRLWLATPCTCQKRPFLSCISGAASDRISMLWTFIALELELALLRFRNRRSPGCDHMTMQLAVVADACRRSMAVPQTPQRCLARSAWSRLRPRRWRDELVHRTDQVDGLLAALLRRQGQPGATEETPVVAVRIRPSCGRNPGSRCRSAPSGWLACPFHRRLCRPAPAPGQTSAQRRPAPSSTFRLPSAMPSSLSSILAVNS